MCKIITKISACKYSFCEEKKNHTARKRSVQISCKQKVQEQRKKNNGQRFSAFCFGGFSTHRSRQSCKSRLLDDWLIMLVQSPAVPWIHVVCHTCASPLSCESVGRHSSSTQLYPASIPADDGGRQVKKKHMHTNLRSPINLAPFWNMFCQRTHTRVRRTCNSTKTGPIVWPGAGKRTKARRKTKTIVRTSDTSSYT